MQEEQCILVDRTDKPIRTLSKLKCHQFDDSDTSVRDSSKLPLHRAFSLFLFSNKGRLLIQQRAACKFTFPGLWANTCCSHPTVLEDGREETTIEAAVRRASKELNLKLIPENVQMAGKVIYHAPDTDYGEHELDHLIVGNNVDEKISFKANPEEVQDAWWVSPADLQAILRNQPDALTPWFRLISQKLLFSEPYNLWNVFAKDSKINALGDKIIDLNEL